MIKHQKTLYKYCCILISVFVFSCHTENRSIDVYSYQIANKTQKAEIFKKYFKDSGLIDYEYHIYYQDNSTGMVPGPSDYNMKVALKVNHNSLNSWMENLEPSSQKISIQLWDELKLDKNVWKMESEPEVYRSVNELKLLFREENIILGIYATTPINFELNNDY